jgi:glycosyltransferase involved in cell wall biosynthesis
MQKANILFCITKLELGGAQKQLLAVIRALDKTTFNVFLFTAKDGLLVEDACRIEQLTIIRSRFLERPLHPAKDLLALLELYRCIKRNKITIVHTHSSKAGIVGRIAARLAKVRVIIHTVHGWSFNAFQPALVRMAYTALERFCGCLTSRIVVCCLADKEKGLLCRIGSEDRYVLIRYGIEYELFGKACSDARQRFGIKGHGPVIGSVACFKPQKAPLDFIEVARLVHERLPDARFVLAGDGVLRPAVEKMIASSGLGDAVVLLGWQQDIPSLLSLFDVFILTSLWEGLPITVLEALASSRPVIATDTGGIREVVKEGVNGFLVRPGDPGALGRQLLRVLTDAGLRKDLSGKARASLAGDYQSSRMVRETHDLYAALVYETEMQ